MPSPAKFGGLRTGLNPIGSLPGGIRPSAPGLSGIPSIPTGDGGLGAALAAAAQGAQDQATAAAQGAVSAAAQAANAAAMTEANKLGLAPALVNLEHGNYSAAGQQAAEVAAIALLSQIGIPASFANGISLVVADAATASSTIAAIGQAVAFLLPELAEILSEEALTEVISTLTAIGVTTSTGAAAGSVVPVVGSAIGAIVGAFVAIGQEIANAFPCGAQALTYQQFWRFVDQGTLGQGENCGALEAIGGHGSASSDLESARLRGIERYVGAIVDRVRAVPDWPTYFLATYAALRKGDDKTPALYAWAPVSGYEHFLADEVFKRLGDEFADWWIQQPGWLTALGTLPVIPVYVANVWASDSVGGTLPISALGPILQGYQAFASAHGGQWAQPDPRTNDGPISGLLGGKPVPISLQINVADHGQIASNLPAMLASHIPGAIGRAIIRRYALIPSTANPINFDLAMVHAAQATDSLGSKAVSDYVSAHITEVAPLIGKQTKVLFGWLPVTKNIYGLPGDPLPPGATPVSPPQYANGDGSGGAAPLPPGVRAALGGAAPAPSSGIPKGLIKLHTSSAGTAAGTSSGRFTLPSDAWTPAPSAPTGPAPTLNTGLSAATLTLQEKVQVQAAYVAKWFGPEAGADIAASYHLTPTQATQAPAMAKRRVR